MKPRIAIPQPCSNDPEYTERALPPYLRAVESCGGEPVVILLDQDPAEIARSITGCSGILLPGSPADVDPQKYGEQRHPKTAPPDPARDAADELLLQDAYNLHKPILGICYGMQSLNVWRSGTLVQHIESQIAHSTRRESEIAHQIRVEPDSLLARSLHRSPNQCGIPVNSTHHQAVDVVGDGLRIVAQSPDDNTIEAIEGTVSGHYVLGVQWHPERTLDLDAHSRLLFESFVEAASHWKMPA